MSSEEIRILLVEDNPADADLMRVLLDEVEGVRYQVEVAESLAEALPRLKDGSFQIGILDLGLPDCKGIETFRSAHGEAPWMPMVVLTGLDDSAIASAAIREGAQDYLVKGQLDAKNLDRSIRYALERHGLLAEAEERKAELEAGLTNLQAVLASSGEGVIVLDRDGRVRFMNESAEAMLGCERGEAFGSFLALPIPRVGLPGADRLVARQQDGRLRDLVVRVQNVRWDGLDCTLAVLSDPAARVPVRSEVSSLVVEVQRRLPPGSPEVLLHPEQGDLTSFEADPSDVVQVALSIVLACRALPGDVTSVAIRLTERDGAPCLHFRAEQRRPTSIDDVKMPVGWATVEELARDLGTGLTIESNPHGVHFHVGLAEAA